MVGGDAAVAQAFVALPFDHLVFTGSTAVGPAGMRAASAHLTPLTLELGGKSPVVIGPGADLAHAAERVLVGKLLNAGQTCIAPDYVLLPAGQEAAFARAAQAVARRLYPDLAHNRDYTRIINARQYQRLADWLAEAEAAGVQALPLADAPDDPGLRSMIRALSSRSKVRMVPSSTASSGMMLGACPPWNRPTVTTAGFFAEISRAVSSCRER